MFADLERFVTAHRGYPPSSASCGFSRSLVSSAGHSDSQVDTAGRKLRPDVELASSFLPDPCQELLRCKLERLIIPCVGPPFAPPRNRTRGKPLSTAASRTREVSCAHPTRDPWAAPCCTTAIRTHTHGRLKAPGAALSYRVSGLVQLLLPRTSRVWNNATGHLRARALRRPRPLRP
jgi:hypothetical protein